MNYEENSFFPAHVVPVAPPMSPAMHGESPVIAPAIPTQFLLSPPPAMPQLHSFTSSPIAPSTPASNHSSNTMVAFSSPTCSAIQTGTVHALASDYMLLEYAAQLKGLTQHRVLKTARGLKHVPREVVQQARRLKQEVAKLVEAVKEYARELASGSKAQKVKLEQIKNSHKFLQSAQELLNQAEIETVQLVQTKRRQSQMHNIPSEEISASAAPKPTQQQLDMVNALSMSFGGATAAASAPQVLPSGPSKAAMEADKVAQLQEQIAKLSEMIFLAKLGTPAATSSGAVPVVAPEGAVNSVGPSVPMAPAMSPRAVTTPIKPVNVPQAPPLKPNSFFFTGIHQVEDETPKIDEADEDSENVKPPTAPTLTTKPNPAPMSSRSGILGEITNRTTPLRPVAAGKKRLSNQRSQSMIEPATVQPKPVIQCYTRRIPGSETMSLTDSIKVASRIKLRRTDQDRSPGGTPMKQTKQYSSSSTQDVLQAALQQRFKNVHAMDAAAKRSQSVILTGSSKDNFNFPVITKRVAPIPPTNTNTLQNRPTHQRRDSTEKENWDTA